ncbi:hypothetical protein DL767_002867 [Monosporascus sp. MG133]|nr:hypothetical protein DL767_002867 [Monosporascus sp. MG133]
MRRRASYTRGCISGSLTTSVEAAKGPLSGGLLRLFCIKPMLAYFWDEATGHATHYCAMCGLNLAYWNGAAYVFARDERLSDAPPAIVGDVDTRTTISKTGIKRYLPSPYRCPVGSQSRPWALRRRTAQSSTLLPATAPSQAAPAEHRSAVIPVEIVFDRFSWAMAIRWTDRAGTTFGGSSSCSSNSRYSISSGPRTDFGTGDKHCLMQRLCFLFVSSEGLLVWTVRKGHRRMALLDAYDRVVAYDDLLLCVFSDDTATTTVPPCRQRLLVAEILVMYVALSSGWRSGRRP